MTLAFSLDQTLGRSDASRLLEQRESGGKSKGLLSSPGDQSVAFKGPLPGWGSQGSVLALLSPRVVEGCQFSGTEEHPVGCSLLPS